MRKCLGGVRWCCPGLEGRNTGVPFTTNLHLGMGGANLYPPGITKKLSLRALQFVWCK